MELLNPDLKEVLRVELRETYKEIMEEANRNFGISRDYLTIPEVCKYMNTSKSTIMKWNSEYDLPIVKIENKMFVSKVDLYDFMSQHKI